MTKSVIMRKYAAAIAFGFVLLLLFVLFGPFFSKTSGIFPFQTKELLPDQSIVSTTSNVVIVSAASYAKLKDFDGIEGFYQKMWDNRMSFAEAHGKLFIV